MDKIEINISSLEDNKLERTVYLNGKEKYHDRRDIRIFPDDNDPIRRFQLFLLGKEPQSGCNGCRYSCNNLNPPDRGGVNIFGKLKQFVVQLFKVCA